MSSPLLRVTAPRTAITTALALGVLAVGGATSAALADDTTQPTVSPAVTTAVTTAAPTAETTPGPVPAEVTAVPVPATGATTSPVHVDAGGGSTGDDTLWLALGGTGAVLAVAGAGLGLVRRRA
ncbi:LPXTG-motif cell wall anchor domain-containing protein [Klenkia soli]|uniref:LPXTG-motif cell wall anchor domain-containing protein n=1 Tax=Klenkia soli TaxID=1052260 RepID=A0A1H0TQW3_9ACTN|nr:LPXTG cell wall anchor domain-containing protein [Klenkia soli]SDP56437.1 LPXTG-motif cell wall anchor domain-containing protein [Klenkia soli]